MKIREAFARFMYGRNGADKLYNCCVISSLVLLLLNLIFRTFVLEILAYALFGYALFRFLSRNVYKRQEENRRFLCFWAKIRNRFSTLKARLTDREHAYRKCPSCKSQLRLPRKKGKHTVRCPRCGVTFDVKI